MSAAKIGKPGLGEDSMVGPYGAGSRNVRVDLLTNLANLQKLAFTSSFYNALDEEQ